MNQHYDRIGKDVVRLSVPTTPADANGLGHVFGGMIFGLMERAAYIIATRHTGLTCVARGMGDVEFAQAVNVGEVLHVVAEVLLCQGTSVVVQVDVFAEAIDRGEVRHTNACLATMVALGPDGKPTQVPEKIPHDRAGMIRYLIGLKAKATSSLARHQLTEEAARLNVLSDQDLKSEIEASVDVRRGTA